MRILVSLFFLALVSMTSCALLEMSQSLWNKVLEGGLTKIGVLDPLRVPIVKVDQSEGNTSYRMILRNVEIVGLNSSSLESIHIARGRLITNLSENEAGYVSYTDQRELDTIRYRFHTVVKEPKGAESQNLEVRPIPELEKSTRSENQQGKTRNYEFSSRTASNYETSSRYRGDRDKINPQDYRTNYESSSRYENQQRNPQIQRSNYESSSSRFENQQQNPQIQRSNYESSPSRFENQQHNPQIQRSNYESSSRYENQQRNPQIQRSNYEMPERRQEPTRFYVQSQNSQNYENFKAMRPESMTYTPPRFSPNQANSRIPEERKDTPGRVRVVYAEKYQEADNDQGAGQRIVTESMGTSGCAGNCEYRRNRYNSQMRNNQQRENMENKQEEDIGVAASVNFESRRAYVDDSMMRPKHEQDNAARGQIHNDGAKSENRYAETFDRKITPARDDHRGKYQQTRGSSSEKLENQPGYVDIVYADDKDKKMRHFGNSRIEPGREPTVYGLDDILRDLRNNNRFIIHNFTEGESLLKKNDAIRMANESKRIKDLIRYAKDFQEKQGYYEEGMELIYHYGGGDNGTVVKNGEGRRTKRAHLNDETEDDVMHVIMRIRVPMLRVKAEYVLTGKVGKQVVRGNGLLASNFTELIGDFTLELKKVGNDTMIVRAARAKLSASDKKITLEGMDEEGPVNEILTEGLMAAEAVAAMLADDLTSKALSEKTADSIIYRMYKNLPADN